MKFHFQLIGLTFSDLIRPTTPTGTALNGGPYDKRLNDEEYAWYKKAMNSFNFCESG